MRGIRIRYLYGKFNYEIFFSEDGITIITGPNGFGKSTILHIIIALANSNIEYFFDLVFSEIEILNSGLKENFIIKKEGESLLICGCKFDRQDFNDWQKYSIKRHMDEQIDNIQNNLLMENIKKVVFEMKNIAGSVVFIKEQRLITGDRLRRVSRGNEIRVYEQKIVETVAEIPNKIQSMVKMVASSYSNISNELDSTFPQRLFAQVDGLKRNEFDLKLSELRDKVEKLQTYGISNIGKLDEIQFKEEDARALKVYFSDFEKKYQQYEELINSLEMFADIINRRFLFKKVYISAKEGLYVLDDEGNDIPLRKLSSGEKETLVLFYQIIFEVSKGWMLLIDEPEISLHIAWQRMFIEDMQAIVRERGIKVIIATHSVQIINGNRRIQRDLGKQYGDSRLD